MALYGLIVLMCH